MTTAVSSAQYCIVILNVYSSFSMRMTEIYGLFHFSLLLNMEIVSVCSFKLALAASSVYTVMIQKITCTLNLVTFQVSVKFSNQKYHRLKIFFLMEVTFFLKLERKANWDEREGQWIKGMLLTTGTTLDVFDKHLNATP